MVLQGPTKSHEGEGRPKAMILRSKHQDMCGTWKVTINVSSLALPCSPRHLRAFPTAFVYLPTSSLNCPETDNVYKLLNALHGDWG